MSSAILFNFICKQSKNALVALAVLAVSGVDPLFAANFTVTNTNDSGAGSLRQAILDANDNTPPSADTIDLTGVAGTITLTSGELAITDALTITGPGANVLTISGNDASRVFSINTPGLAVKISDLQITNGYEDSDNGGGMLITAGTVTLDRLVIGGPTTGETNFAAAGGAIWNMGTLTINHSSIMTNVGSFDAGGIMNTGSVTIANSTISGNNAGPGIGGGIWTTGTVRLTNSTIADNEATDGGGIYVDNASTADISNSTIAGNLRGPSGEGGAIYAASTATVNLKNTIVANSKHKDTLVVVDNCFQAAAGIVSFGYNLSDDASCTSLIATGDMQSANAGLDPLGLQDNGGTTLTIALQVSSDARAAIPTFALCRDKFFQNIETDQRGIPRPQGLNCDIGAYELDGGGGAILLVTSTTDEDPGSLRNVIAAAEPDDIVQFHDSLFAGGNVTLTFPRTTDGKCGPLKDARATALVIDKSLTIAGPGRDFLTLSGTGASDDCRVVWVEPNISTLFSGLTIAAGQITQQFGANFYNKGSTTLSDCAVTGGTIVNFGGGAGIYNAASGLPLAVNNCVIANNEITGTSSFHGAGIAHQGTGLLTLTDTTVTGNTGGNYGAAIASESNGDLTILSSTISNNVGRYHGGVYTFGAGKLTLTNSTLSGNTVTDKVGSQSWGGGLYIAGSDLALITNSTIAANDGYNFIAGTANIFFKNTILADSEIDNCRDENASSFFNVRTSGHNLADDASCGFFIKAPVGTDRPSTDPLLGPLQDNGGLGPTETHALLAGSVALDDIPLANCTLVTNSQTQNTPVSKDQRGISRPQGLNCDIGAYELESAQALLDPTTTWNVTPQVQSFPAGRVCPAGTLLSDKFQNVTAGGESGSTFATFPVDGVDVTITISWGNDNTIDFDVENGVLPRVFVKGGGESYLLYQYDPPVAAATNSGPVSSDTDLHDGFNNDQGTFQDVSHLDFCVLTIAAPLRAEKTANASYDERHDWDVLKTVDPTSQSEFAGNAVSWTWTIDIFEQVVNQNFAVTGNIAVYNDNDFDVPVSIADVLDDGTVATITCPVTNDNTGTVPANGSLICPYSASPADASATLNTATITSGNPDVEGDSATAPVNFIANVVNDEATVTDTVIGLIGESVSGGNQFTADEGDVCSSDQAVYGEDGKYEVSLINTAILTDEEGTEYESTANGSYTCYAPLVTKDASASYDERWTWTLTKTVDPTSQSGYPGDNLPWTWTIDIIETITDENFSVTGNIDVTNPAGSPDNMTVEVADQLSDATVATVDCGAGATSVVVAPGATETCSYSASPTDDSATSNTATGTFNGIDFTGTADVSFVKSVENDEATLSDTEIGLTDESVVGDDQFTADDSHDCSSDWADYGADGTYSETISNTATLVDEEGTEYTSTAETTYTCEAGTIDVLKYTYGVVDDTYDWRFALYVGPDGFGGTQVGNSSSTLNDADGVLDFGDPIPALRLDTTYTVCELGVAAGWATNWSIGGSTVIPYNPNADDPLPEDLGNRCFDVGAGTSYPVIVGQNLRIAVNNTFPGGDARTPGYWKNWSSCSGGGQYAKTTDDVDPANEFVSLDEVLNDPGISWCDFTIDSCELAVSILDQRDFESGKKMSSDSAYTLAMHLLAAELNYGAGAERCDLADDAIVAARILICDLGFDATGAYLRPKGQTYADYYYALDLKDLLDDYNNGRLCGEEIAFDFPPNVSIDEPAEGDVIGDGGANEVTTVTIEASTSDDYGVTQVEFFVGGVSIGVDSDDSDGWSANWDVNGLADATYSLVATATDTIGQTASHSIEVTLDNETGEPMHIGDLDPDNASGKGGKWDATVTITVHDETHAPVEGALVSGAWTGGAANSCSTDGSGKCSITLSNINRNANAVSFTVDSVSAVGYDYLSGGNHGPDGESNGTTIAISKP